MCWGIRFPRNPCGTRTCCRASSELPTPCIAPGLPPQPGADQTRSHCPVPSPHPAPARPSAPGSPPDTHPATHHDRTGSSAALSTSSVTQPDRRRAPSRWFRSCHARCQQERQEPTPPTGTLTCVPRGSRGREAGGREDNHLSLSIPQGAE